MGTTDRELIHILKEKLPRGGGPARMLMELFSMSKEAAYRRLREEVPFSLDEAVTISHHLGISLDRLGGGTGAEKSFFNLDICHNTDTGRTYREIVQNYLAFYQKIEGDGAGEVYMAANVLPFVLTANYETLSRYCFGRWATQHQNNQAKPDLLGTEIPADVVELRTQMATLARRVPYTCMIFDNHIFSGLVSDINYFARLGALSTVGVDELRGELLSLVNELEEYCISGCFAPGSELEVFLSNLHFDTTYGYIASSRLQGSLFRVYNLNMIASQQPQLAAVQKEWIYSLKRYSTLISQSGEMQRVAFFDEQRRLIEAL